MDRRTILAVALSLGVLLLWSGYVSRTKKSAQVTVNKEVTMVKPAQVTESAPVIKPYDLTWAQINFIPAQAAIESIAFKEYQNHKLQLYSGLLLDDPTLKFSSEFLPNAVSFTYQDEDKKITKILRIDSASKVMQVTITINNLSGRLLDINLPFILGKIVQSNSIDGRFVEIMIMETNDTSHRGLRNDFISAGPAKYIALRDRYFCAILQPLTGEFKGISRKLDNKSADIGLQLIFHVPAREEATAKFDLYLGPQNIKALGNLNKDWAGLVYYGGLDPIARILLGFLEGLHRICFNWGLAIILLSVLIYLLLYPLSIKQIRSMKEMQALQPKIEALRQLYKDNPQKLNKEIMQLYKDHKVNPFGGCLPLVLQMPIFFALYQVLMRSVELKGASFLWIKDLSLPDQLFVLPQSLPVIGNEINILPILMAIGMFFQQKLTSKISSGVSSEQQRMMLTIMPILFGFIFYHMPSGLVLYWFVNSMLMLVFQLRVGAAK